MKKLLNTGVLGGAIVLGLALPATATLYDINFTATDGSTVTATGSINVSGGVATSGSLNVSGPGWLTFPGTYSLCTDYSETAAQGGFGGPGYTSPNGYGNFDNAFSSAGPYIDSAGLLFTVDVPNQNTYAGANTTLMEEVFLTFDGGGHYGLWDDFNAGDSTNPNSLGLDADQSPNGQYEFTGNFNAVVPEPSTIIAGVSMLTPFGAGALRMLRKIRKA